MILIIHLDLNTRYTFLVNHFMYWKRNLCSSDSFFTRLQKKEERVIPGNVVLPSFSRYLHQIS